MDYRDWTFPPPVFPEREKLAAPGAPAMGPSLSGYAYATLNTCSASIGVDLPGDVSIETGEGGKVYVNADLVVRGRITQERPEAAPWVEEAASIFLAKKRGR